MTKNARRIMDVSKVLFLIALNTHVDDLEKLLTRRTSTDCFAT